MTLFYHPTQEHSQIAMPEVTVEGKTYPDRVYFPRHHHVEVPDDRFYDHEELLKMGYLYCSPEQQAKHAKQQAKKTRLEE